MLSECISYGASTNISYILPKSSLVKISFSRAATRRPVKLNKSHETHWNDKMFMSFLRELLALLILTFLLRVLPAITQTEKSNIRKLLVPLESSLMKSEPQTSVKFLNSTSKSHWSQPTGGVIRSHICLGLSQVLLSAV